MRHCVLWELELGINSLEVRISRKENVHLQTDNVLQYNLFISGQEDRPQWKNSRTDAHKKITLIYVTKITYLGGWSFIVRQNKYEINNNIIIIIIIIINVIIIL